MKKIFLETLAKGNRKESFHADIASDYIVIHTSAKNLSVRFPKALIEKCLDCFSEKDWFILDNAIDGVTPEELKDSEYANHIASLLVHMGKLEYRYGANNQLELRVKDPSLKPVMFQESSRDSKATCFNLRFSMSEIPYWASRYEDNDNVAYKVGQSAKERGYLNKEEFLSICYWKSPRSRPMCKKNSEKQVEERTQQALSIYGEELRIKTLILLHGVSWPTASVILHFCHKDNYPVLDYRALWSISSEKKPSSYTFQFWWNYTVYCRALASKAGVDMRTLDQALWQYSKEKQI